MYIGGWQNAGTLCCGRADVLAVIVFGRAVTAADFNAVRRRYCQLAGEGYPTAPPVSFIGNSFTAGYPVGFGGSYPVQMAQALGLAWGTWDQLGVSGFTWFDMLNRTLPAFGNVSGATCARSIVCAFEFENMRTQPLATITGAARQVIDALHAQGPDREVILGSSVNDGSQVGVSTRQTQSGYNAYWDKAATARASPPMCRCTSIRRSAWKARPPPTAPSIPGSRRTTNI